jgi:Holliday junction DNA helicase RuvA
VQGNTKQLESVKGIGRKTAERLVVELKDKLGKISTEFVATVVNTDVLKLRDAVNALVGLGIAKPVAEAAVKKVSESDKEALSLEDIIKQALKNL